MISKDMKYTALYWALRFVENQLDVHEKSYNGYKVTIYAEKHYVDFGEKIKNGRRFELNSHKSFVVLECVDRLLTQGYLPEQIAIDDFFDIYLETKSGNVGIYCEAWDDYGGGIGQDFADYEVFYTSRLVSGLLEYKGEYYSYGFEFHFGVGSDEYAVNIPTSSDFEIKGSELILYKGKSKTIKVPEGIKSIGASAFWNNVFVEDVILPESLERLGGDCFYYCKNLKKVNIPKKVWIMGNNPFAGCPKLQITNESPNFILENGGLYDKDKTNLIHYSISNPQTEFIVPDGVMCLGKHCFYACNNLRKIVIPESVIRFENNPFSGCEHLSLESHTPHYVIENGVIYNKFKTTIVGCLNGSQIDCLRIPETVSLISRNSFWNCKGVKKIVITKNVDRIGYNPFAGCENLIIESENDNFVVKNGVVYDKTLTHILCATDKAIGKEFTVPDGITHINRGVFSGCKSLENIDFNGVTYIDKSSFTNCVGLTDIYVPDTVTYIGEWAFAYCVNLKKVSVGKNTFVDKNAFNECSAVIERRN